MKKRASFIKLTKLWGIIFLVGIGVSIVAIDVIGSHRDFHIRAEQMRADYIATQKQILKQEVHRVVDLISYQKSQSEVLTRRKIKSRVYEAHSIAKNIYQQNRALKGDTEIQQMILDVLRPIRFEIGSGYYFVIRMDGMVMLNANKPELDGRNMLSLQDTHGKSFIKEMIKIGRQSGEGFDEYYWVKPGVEGNNFKKISFIKIFKPYSWIIGAGLYVDDVMEQIKKDVLSPISRIRFGKEGYIFINRFNGDALVSNGRLFSGTKKLWEVFDKHPEKMKDIFEKEYSAALKPEGGYIYYSHIKLTNPNKESPKVSFVYGIPDLQWLVGAGVYLDDVETDIALMQTKLNDQIKAKMLYFIMIVMGIVTLFFLFFNWLSRGLKNDFKLFISFFMRAAHSDKELDRDPIKFIELDQMAEYANKMLTDRKQAEEALKESEEKYRTQFEEALDAIFVADVETGILVDCNQAALEMVGMARSELIGKHQRILHPPEETESEISNTFEKHLKEKEGQTLKSQVITKNGEIKEVSIKANLFKLRGKTFLQGIFRDITERQQAEEALRESEEKYRSIYENVQDVYYETSLDGFILEISPSIENISQYKQRELIGKSIYDLYTNPNERDKLIKVILDKGKVSDYEINLSDKDGSQKICSINTKLIMDEQGNPLKFVGSMRDITKRKQTEEALRSEKLLSEEYINSLPGLFYIFDDQRFVRWNREWNRVTGYSDEELSSKYGTDFFEGEDRTLIGERMLKVFREGAAEAEAELVTKDGQRIPYYFTGLRKNLNGKDHLIGLGIDITERKRVEDEKAIVEAQLQQAQKMESIGTLAGGIAHDFNNILSTILSNFFLAKDQVASGSETYELLREAETALKRAQSLTHQLLTFAKGGAPVKETASLGNIIKESSLFVVRGSKSDCAFSIAEDLWAVEADVGQINQVINNIVINADQAMPEGGIIRVEARNMMIDKESDFLLKPGKYIRISVKDQGVGIAEKYLSKIFDPYFSTKQTGSGIGLTTSYSIIKKHGGHITLESALGKGTTFHIYLPASEKVVQEIRESKEIKGQGKILVMDDEASLRKVVERMLEMLGYESQSAKDGVEAIEMYKGAKEAKKPYDAVILDLTISGGMGGKEAIQKLLEIDPEVKAVVSSGYSKDPVLANFQDYGFKGMLPKPFEAVSLSKVLHKVLQS